MEENLTVRFRVGDVFKNKVIAVYFDDQLISKKKRQVMAPGEIGAGDFKEKQTGRISGDKEDYDSDRGGISNE